MNFLFVVVLDAEDQTEVDAILVAVLLYHMNKVIEHGVAELLDILDDKDDWLVNFDTLALQNLLHS